MNINRLKSLAGFEIVEAPTEEVKTEEVVMESLTLDRALTIAGFEVEPIIESVEEEADTFIVFEAKGSPNVIGVFRSADDAKNVMKKFKRAVGKAYKSK